jgi:hypothetical protein
LILKMFPPIHRRQLVSQHVSADGADAASPRERSRCDTICIEGWQQRADDLELLQELIGPT